MADALTTKRPAEASLTGESPQRLGDPRTDGVLLGPLASEDDHKKVATAAMRQWEAGDDYWQRDVEQWRLNAARRQGYTNGQLRRGGVDDDHWTAWFPKNASPDMSRDANKAAQLCRRFVSIMFADPPAPEVEPPSGEDGDQDGAEFAARVLLDLQSPGQLNTPKKCRTAFDKGSDHGSGFVYYYVDPQGGGRAPIEVEARSDATHVQNALINPLTGAEEPPYTTRYAREDGALTDNEAEAATRWLPKLCSEVVTGRNVRPIPHTAADIADARGAQLLVFRPWGDVRRRFPDVAGLPEEQKKALFDYQPENASRICSQRELAAFSNADNGNDEERLVAVLTTFMEQQPDYEDGLYLVTLGETFVAYRGHWIEERPDGAKRRAIIPLAQLPQFDEGRDTFFRVGLMELVGGANEVRAAQVAHLLDYLEKLNNQKIFLPTNSVISPQMLQYPRATVLPMNPGGEPKYQEVPRYPPESMDMHERMGQEMDNASGLQETAQGLEDSGVNSGRHALAIIGQAQAGLSEPRENIATGYVRCCHIELQLVRMFYSAPRRLKWSGDDAKYKEKRWSGSDLIGETDIKLRPGSLSMMTPAAKAQLTEHLYTNLGLLSPDEAKELITSNLGALIGLQDDPFRMRIRRQLAAFEEGPPEGWAEGRAQQAEQIAQQQTMAQGQQQAQAYAMVAGEVAAQGMIPPAPPAPLPPVAAQPIPTVQQDPITGQVVITDPHLAQIWAPIPCDDLPNIAALRLNEMAKFMASTRYERLSADWRAGLDAEYQRAVMASMPPAPVAPSGEGGEAPPQGPALSEAEQAMAGGIAA